MCLGKRKPQRHNHGAMLLLRTGRHSLMPASDQSVGGVPRCLINAFGVLIKSLHRSWSLSRTVLCICIFLPPSSFPFPWTCLLFGPAAVAAAPRARLPCVALADAAGAPVQQPWEAVGQRRLACCGRAPVACVLPRTLRAPCGMCCRTGEIASHDLN